MNTAKFMAEKMNRPPNAILNLPLSSAFLFTRGQPGREVQKYDLRSHTRYSFLPEARQECLKDEVAIGR